MPVKRFEFVLHCKIIIQSQRLETLHYSPWFVPNAARRWSFHHLGAKPIQLTQVVSNDGQKFVGVIAVHSEVFKEIALEGLAQGVCAFEYQPAVQDRTFGNEHRRPQHRRCIEAWSAFKEFAHRRNLTSQDGEATLSSPCVPIQRTVQEAVLSLEYLLGLLFRDLGSPYHLRDHGKRDVQGFRYALA